MSNYNCRICGKQIITSQNEIIPTSGICQCFQSNAYENSIIYTVHKIEKELNSKLDRIIQMLESGM